MDPYFKVESEGATTLFVRDIVGIPAPAIIWFDSSGANPLGLEAIFMEYMLGTTVQAWLNTELQMEDSLIQKDYAAFMVPTLRQVQSYVEKLQGISFDRIGSLYYDWEGDGGYLIGPIANLHFSAGPYRRSKLDRGPFAGPLAYLPGLIDAWVPDIIPAMVQGGNPCQELMPDMESSPKSKSEFDSEPSSSSSSSGEVCITPPDSEDCDGMMKMINVAELNRSLPTPSLPSAPSLPILLAPPTPIKDGTPSPIQPGLLPSNMQQRIDLARDLVVLLAHRCPQIFQVSPPNSNGANTGVAHATATDAADRAGYFRPHVYHTDLHADNIMAHPTTGAVTALLDWEHTKVCPGCCRSPLPLVMYYQVGPRLVASMSLGERIWLPYGLSETNKNLSLAGFLAEMQVGTPASSFAWHGAAAAEAAEAAPAIVGDDGYWIPREFAPLDEAVSIQSAVLGDVVGLLHTVAVWDERYEGAVKEAVQMLQRW